MTLRRILARTAPLLCAVLVIAPTSGGPLDRALETITAAVLRAHVFFLASDALRGRAPGSPGGAAAAAYIASEFLRAGLQPVGGSYYQRFPLLGIRTDTANALLVFDGGADELRAGYGTDAVVWPGSPSAPASVTGEVVFAGYGIAAPAFDWDDFKGKDLRGKILLVLVSEPPAPPEEPDLFDGFALTYYGRWPFKIEEAERQGAAAVMMIHTADAAGYPWSVVRSSWAGEVLTLPREAGAPTGLPLEGWVTYDFAKKLLALGGQNLDELYVSAARRDFRPVATGITLRARVPASIHRIEAANVVGLLPGRDSTLSDEVVVYTAHYDHLGVGPPVAGDSIYNGAYDNASGVALMLEVARVLAVLETPPRRSILFLSTTAEEAGMLGSTYYARHPLLPIDRTVAALNVDGANVWGETDDVSAFGADRSTLGAVLEKQATEMHMRVAPERAPEQGLFFRSDQFPFARAGVPALAIVHGLVFRGRPPGWGRDKLRLYDAERYHRPSDEMDPSFTFEGAVQQARLSARVGFDIAEARTRPEWYAGRRPAIR